MQDIFEQMQKIISEQFGVDESSVTESTSFEEDLGADSANLMMLIMDLEMEYDITVSDDMLTGVRCVGDIVKYLEENT